MKIRQIKGQEILDSRGQPTIACVMTLDTNVTVSASVPAGASVGKYEAVELRDNDPARFGGKGMLSAINNLEKQIAPLLVGKEPDIIAMDADMLALDGTPHKSKLGANAMLAASIAIVRAQAVQNNLETYEFINRLWNFSAPSLPLCMFNVINGGMHAQSGLAFQECMIMPRSSDVKKNIEAASSAYTLLKQMLVSMDYATGVGDEGGFAPRFTQHGIAREQAALCLLTDIVQQVHSDTVLCLDVAASHFYDEQEKIYRIHHETYDTEKLINLYRDLCKKYPIVSIEDGLDQDDWDGWKVLTASLGKNLTLVGDDIFVTFIDRISKGIHNGVANAVLIKPNQIGTVTQTIQAIQLSKKAGYQVVISHRSGETNDDFIADLAVGTSANYLKAGAPARGERVAKYNRLMAIADRLS